MIGRMFPQGAQGLGTALQDASPLLLAMAQGLQSGQGAFAQAPQGIAAMMQGVEKRKGDALFQDLMGGGINTGQTMQQPAGAPTLAGVMGSGTVPQAGVPQNVNPAVAGAMQGAAGGTSTLDLIRRFEGYRDTPYWDVNAHRTGYGSDTITRADGSVVRVQPGMKIGRDDAERDLQRRVSTEFEPIAARAAGGMWDQLSEPQRAALTSIAYNYGRIPDNVTQALRTGGDVPAAIMQLSGHNDGVNAGRRQQEAQIFATGGTGTNQYGQSVTMEAPDPQRLARLYEALGSSSLSDAQRQAIMMRIQAEEQRTQPMTPMEQIQLQTAQEQLRRLQTPERPEPVFQGGQWWDTSTGQPVALTEAPTGDNQAERDIAMLGELGISRDEAIRITQLNHVSRDPTTGEVVIINRQTGQPVGGMDGMGAQEVPPIAPGLAAPADAGEGLQFPNADSSFGARGAATRALNTISDVAGFGVPFPGQQETQANFNVLRETLRTNIASSYGSRPSNFVLQQIDELLPRAGSVRQGPDGARRDLEALERVMRSERAAVSQALNRPMSPQNRQEVEAQIHSLDTSLAQIGTALGAFGGARGSDAAQAGSAPEGVEQRVWEFMTPEERALWQ